MFLTFLISILALKEASAASCSDVCSVPTYLTCISACSGTDIALCESSDWILCKVGCLGISSCMDSCYQAIVQPCKEKLVDQCNAACDNNFRKPCIRSCESTGFLTCCNSLEISTAGYIGVAACLATAGTADVITAEKIVPAFTIGCLELVLGATTTALLVDCLTSKPSPQPTPVILPPTTPVIPPHVTPVIPPPATPPAPTPSPSPTTQECEQVCPSRKCCRKEASDPGKCCSGTLDMCCGDTCVSPDLDDVLTALQVTDLTPAVLQDLDPFTLLYSQSPQTCTGCRKDLYAGGYFNCDSSQSWPSFPAQKTVTFDDCQLLCGEDDRCNFFTSYDNLICNLFLTASCNPETGGAIGDTYARKAETACTVNQAGQTECVPRTFLSPNNYYSVTKRMIPNCTKFPNSAGMLNIKGYYDNAIPNWVNGRGGQICRCADASNPGIIYAWTPDGKNTKIGCTTYGNCEKRIAEELETNFPPTPISAIRYTCHSALSTDLYVRDFLQYSDLSPSFKGPKTYNYVNARENYAQDYFFCQQKWLGPDGGNSFGYADGKSEWFAISLEEADAIIRFPVIY